MADNSLTLGDFPVFFNALWQDPASGEPLTPFPWQVELLAQLDAERRWPKLIDLPTGSGKTSILDLAVFLMALDGLRPAEDRWMPRRVALVVDRRQVVDQADLRAHTIVEKLGKAEAGVLVRVREGLAKLSVDGQPLVNTVLRGGIVRDERWARRPDVPALISSTVDQVGSRLLFRGYGVTTGMRPIHAGLLGNDTLFVLDEVHLARPFAQTLRAVAEYRQPFKDEALGTPDRWGVVEMSATPVSGGAVPEHERFPSEPIDPASHPVLRRRMQARKGAALVEVKVAKDQAKANEQFATACTKEARQLLAGGSTVIGVIVNRVDTARRVALALQVEPKKGSPPDVVLLTGRMRSLDRDRAMREYGSRLEIGRDRDQDHPLVVVATQSIEAGADFDLDGIVTECASFDALRQRFGRVDRDGRLTEQGTPARSAILVRSTDVSSDERDPVYGVALRNTWNWLVAQPEVDFRIGALAPDEVQALTPDPTDAPLLFPNHLDQWVQTSQRPPMTDPDVSRWLHGLEASNEAAEVSVVWRSDLDESLFSQDPDLDSRLVQQITDRVAACPPASSEALAVSIRAFRRWARRESDAQLTDVPGIIDPADDSGPSDPVRTPTGVAMGIGSRRAAPGGSGQARRHRHRPEHSRRDKPLELGSVVDRTRRRSGDGGIG